MKELVTANGIVYECKSVSTGMDSITFAVEGYTANDMLENFADVGELTVSYAGKDPHGTYENLKLESVSTNADDGSVSVKMHIKSETERRLDALEESQKKQDETISMISSASGISI